LHRASARDGVDWSNQNIASAVLGLPAKSCIIDGELIATGVHGESDFLALLHGRHVPTCVYAFDLLEIQGRDLLNRSCSGARGCKRC
jgi:bifunctional non-homologous end joining protein LigD